MKNVLLAILLTVILKLGKVVFGDKFNGGDTGNDSHENESDDEHEDLYEDDNEV